MVLAMIITSSLDELAKSCSRFKFNAVPKIRSALTRIDSIKFDDPDLNKLLEDGRKKLVNAQEISEKFISAVGSFFDYADLSEDGMQEFKDAFKEKKIKRLKTYIDELTERSKQCCETYDEFVQLYKSDIESHWEEAVKIYTSKQESAEAEATTAKAVAATATTVAATIGGAVTVSIVAGLATFGIGTVVGLLATGITVGSVAIVGAGTAVGDGVSTHLVASKYRNEREKLLCVQKDLEELNRDVTQMMDKVKEDLKSALNKIDNTANENVEFDKFCSMFDTLLEGTRRGHQLFLVEL